MDTILSRKVHLSTEELVRYYHAIKPKLRYNQICCIISKHHGQSLTIRRMKEICRNLGLNRVMNVTNDELKAIIEIEMETSRSNFGYRQLAESICLRYNINVSRENVRLALKEIDPTGVEERSKNVIKRRIYETEGPGDVYHIDGNDKLKRWGFAIHGCIDGFSRKLLWLIVASSNNDPLIVANFYLNCIKKHGSCPRTLRMDKGTENIYCEDLQTFFTGRNNSFIYASSTRNQRIEAFWSRLKKFRTSWWIDLFSVMVKDKIIQPESICHQEVLIFCFMPVIQAELNEFLLIWNARNVRQSARAPGGRPDVLFALPSTVGFEKQGILVNENDIVIAKNILGISHHPVSVEKDLHELLVCYCAIYKLSIPCDADGALDLFIKLIELRK